MTAERLSRSYWLLLLLLPFSTDALSVGGKDPIASASSTGISSSSIDSSSSSSSRRRSSSSSSSSRRTLFSHTTKTAAASLSFVLLGGEAANAKDEIYKKNPLTNRAFEQIRIWEQVEADNIRYDGELEKGDAGNQGKVDAYPKLLVPILKISSELSQINTLVHDPATYGQAQKILSQSKYDKIEFKKTFNKFGDNIYYSDPERANAYLAGGATPNSQQSVAYLLRNDMLTNVENLRAELDYFLKKTTSAEEKAQTDDLYSYAITCDNAMKKYLALVPPDEVKVARELLAAEK